MNSKILKYVPYALVVLGVLAITPRLYDRVNAPEFYLSKNQAEIRASEHPREPIKHQALEGVLAGMGLTATLCGASILMSRKENQEE